jgi:hypothetical protein
MTFEVRNSEVEERLKMIGNRLRDALVGVPGYGFALLIFSFNDDGNGGNMFYTSSADRDDVIKAMREFIEKHEKK